MDSLTPAGLWDAADLLREALPDEMPTHVGGYEIVREIAQGGMGVVYEARHALGHTVALKMVRPVVFWEGALELFRREVQVTAVAQHPHIVQIWFVGEHDDQLYYTMPIYRGSLASLRCEVDTPERIAEVIEQMARGVQHAHQRGVLHLDLKPANVLIDELGNSRVADFGLARFVAGTPPELRDTGSPLASMLPRSGSRSVLGGTPPYSPPEQDSGEGPITTASDVYSIGAVLFELLTGSLPDPLALENGASPPQRSLLRPLRRELLLIARKCMQTDPEQRYRSAAALADDIGRARRHEPTEAGSQGAWDRLLGWCRRHPRLALWAAILSIVVPVMVAGGLRIMTDWAQEQIDNVLLANGLAARFAAGSIQRELGEKMAEVERIAADPRIAALAAGAPIHDAQVLQPYQERGFGLVGVYDRAGVITALWPEGPANVLGRDYAWRDYFRGACRPGQRQLPGAYVARAFQSENDGDYNLSISAPILENGECVGLVLASILTDSSVGSMHLNDQNNPRHKGVLIGPEDRRRADPVGTFPRDYLVLVHDALQPAQGVSLSGNPALVALEERFGATRPRGRQLDLPEVAPLTTESYRDPLDAEHRWLAAFYPVGGTGLVVGVQTRDDLADRLGDHVIPILTLLGVAGAATLLSALGQGVLRASAAKPAAPESGQGG